MVRYSLYLGTPEGEIVTPLPLRSGTYTDGYNRVNVGEFILAGDWREPPPESYFRRNNRLYLYRRATETGPNRLINIFLLRRYAIGVDDAGFVWVAFYGADVNDLLRGRSIAEYAGTAGGTKSGYTGNIMKSFVSDALGSGAALDYDGNPTTGRDLTSDGFAVAGDVNDGPSLTNFSAAWESSLLDALVDLYDISVTKGAPVYFRIIPIAATPDVINFRTYAGQPGRNLVDAAFPPVGVTFGTLASPVLDEDFFDEATHIYAVGQNEGTARVVKEATDADRVFGPWGRRERVVDARGEEDPNAVQNAADAALASSSSISTFTASILSTETAPFGEPTGWNVGDRIPVSFFGRVIEAVVEVVSVSFDESGVETVNAPVSIKL